MINGASLLPLVAAFLTTASAQTDAVAPDARFDSIELHGGGVLTLRYGPTHRVRVIEGSAARRIRTDAGRLVVDPCARPCTGGHRIKVEVETPAVARLAVSNGGLLQLQGDFPPQAALTVAVDNGGMVDARALESSRVAAGVSSGGGIMVHSGGEIDATISDGGSVTYWGRPRVRSAVRRGGAVGPGDPADLRRPIASLNQVGPGVPPVPPVPRY